MSTILDTLEIVIWIVTIPALIFVMIGTIILLAKPGVDRLVKLRIDNSSISWPVLLLTSFLLINALLFMLIVTRKPVVESLDLSEYVLPDYLIMEVGSPDYLEAEHVMTNGGQDPVKGIFRDSRDNIYYLEFSSSESTIKNIVEINNSYVLIPVKAVYDGKDLYINSIYLDIRENEMIEYLKIPSTVSSVTLDISGCDFLEAISFGNVGKTNTCHISLSINDCENLQSIRLPECETVIDSLSIKSCPSLEKIDVPSIITINEENVVFKPNSTKDIVVNSDNDLIKEILHE